MPPNRHEDPVLHRCSLDGFIATEDDSLEWLFPLGDINDTSYPAFIKDVGALAMGSATYEWMLRHVVKPRTPEPSPWPYAQPTWVFSTARSRRCRAPTSVLSGETFFPSTRNESAAQGKNLWLVGGGELVGQFYDAGLLDEIIVQVGSVTLGRGKRLLPRRIVGSSALSLTSVQRVGPGFAELRYDVPHRT